MGAHLILKDVYEVDLPMSLNQCVSLAIARTVECSEGNRKNWDCSGGGSGLDSPKGGVGVLNMEQ